MRLAMSNIVALRDRLAEAIEHPIAVLNALDGDADLEPSGDEHEPSLGSLRGTITAAPMSQSRWAFACGAYDDTEEEDDGREPDADAEECNGDRPISLHASRPGGEHEHLARHPAGSSGGRSLPDDDTR